MAAAVSRRAFQSLSSSSNARLYSSISSSTAGSEIRELLLQSALPHIPHHGFSINAIQEAIRSTSELSSLKDSSPLGIDQLFPSLPPRSLPSISIPFRRKPFLKLEELVEKERLGPAKALFDTWHQSNREKLRSEEERSHVSNLKDAFRRRLEYNLPILPHLKTGLSTLAISNPNAISFPHVLGGYASYIQHIAYDIHSITSNSPNPAGGLEIARLASVYGMSEMYQLSNARPDMKGVMDYVDELLEGSGRLSGSLKGGGEFGGYVINSSKTILKSRGF